MAMEYRWADNQIGRLPALATELVRRRVDVVTAAGGPAAAAAAKTATTTIPIVFSTAEDPVLCLWSQNPVSRKRRSSQAETGSTIKSILSTSVLE